MSGSTSAAAKLTLIANPKSRKDWENNQAYYQEKFFSRKQKQVLKEAKRKEEIAWKEIDVRQQNGLCNSLFYTSANGDKNVKRANWKHTAESLAIFQNSLQNLEDNTDTHDWEENLCGTAEVAASENVINLKGNVCIVGVSSEVVDSWEDLC